MATVCPSRTLEALSIALCEIPPIPPGMKVKIDIYNTGKDLITTVSYPDKENNICTCLIYLLITLAVLVAIYYFIRWLIQRYSTPPNTNDKSSNDKNDGDGTENVKGKENPVTDTDTPIKEGNEVANNETEDNNDLAGGNKEEKDGEDNKEPEEKEETENKTE